MPRMGVRGEYHIGVPHLIAGKGRSAQTRLPRRVREAGVDVEGDVREPDDKSGVADPPQRWGGRNGQIDFADKVRAAGDRLKQV